ncbi:MAG: flagellar hook assembly protein FlgD [Xanthobacteraceae bacterium]
MTTTATTNSTASATASAANNSASQQLAGNFDEFLQLLTTQLQNQDPLDPMDANSFTQELVEFSSVEQQINTNTNMQTLISLQQTTAATQALQLVGSTVTVSGSSAALSNATSSPATWSLNAASPATANITITSSSGQTAYTGATTLNAGTNSYTWNGQGNNGVVWPDGTYTIAVTATGANGQTVAVSTQTQGVVSAVNMSATPPTLTVGGQSVPISSVESIGSGGTSSLSSLSSLNSSISSLNSTIGNLIQSL